jgi:F-type H+-transporting ATPase subunit gamma
MASIKDLKKRISTVKSTQQTTRAMKMVSAAKLRRAQEAIQNHRPYAKKVGGLLQTLAPLAGESVKSPLLKRDDLESSETKKKVLFVLVTSDRGLCAGFNGNIIKTAQRWLRNHASSYESVKMGYLGKRGYDFFKTRKVGQGPYFQDLGGKVSFAKAKKFADSLIEIYLSGEVDEVKIVYNEFKNAVTQQVIVEDFLPLAAPEQPAQGEGAQGTALAPNYLFRPDAATLLHRLLEKHFAIQTFRIMLESQAGEHGARMSAMENATKNAGEMIRGLTLEYNKQRQAGITKELLEIISGSESQKVG